jgi:hypothetical protein
MMLAFTYCPNFATAQSHVIPWEKFCDTLTHSVAFPSKDASRARGAFIGGPLKDPARNRADDNIASRTAVVADMDAVTVDIVEAELFLRMNISSACVAYSTFRHTPDKPRIRVCLPLSRPVNQDEHRAIVSALAEMLAPIGNLDACSWVWAQLMFLPSHQQGVEPWSLRIEGEPLPVEDWISGQSSGMSGQSSGISGQSSGMSAQSSENLDDLDAGGVSDLEMAIAQRPLDLTPGDVDSILDRWPAEGLDYDHWAEVGMALYHQHEGSDEGYRRWIAWSEKSSKHDPRQMRTKWRSFGGRARPKTMASIIKHAGGLRQALELAPAGDTFAALEAQAASLADVGAYIEMRDRVRGLSETALPMAMRSALALVAYEAFGKRGGMSKAEVKRDFRPARRRGPGGVGEQSGPEMGGAGGGFSGPDWLSDWVFCEADNSFERISVRHSVIPAAFRTSYGNMPEVLAAEMDAVTYARQVCHLRVVDGLMFWPGAGAFFEHRALRYLNTYETSGVTPCATLEGDGDGQGVVELFMAHVRNLIPSEREQRILIDFMAYVYQHPGKRVRWAPVLVGIEGAGKTYFFTVMQLLLGHNAKTVSTTAINSDFTGWATNARLINIDEIRIAGTNKYAILDKMKPMISDDTISVIYKGRDERSVPNFASYMMSTNHADAIPVSDNDRRYCVITTRWTRKEELLRGLGGGTAEGVAAYFQKLFAETARRADALARWLADWKISADFNPEGRAPETAGLEAMRSLHVSDERDAVEDAIEAFAGPIISTTLLDVTELNRQATLDGRTLPGGRALSHVLCDMGLVQIEGRRLKLRDRIYHYVWYDKSAMTSEEARCRVQEFHDGGRGLSDVPF